MLDGPSAAQNCGTMQDDPPNELAQDPLDLPGETGAVRESPGGVRPTVEQRPLRALTNFAVAPLADLTRPKMRLRHRLRT